jgi:hypothetical protein
MTGDVQTPEERRSRVRDLVRLFRGASMKEDRHLQQIVI